MSDKNEEKTPCKDIKLTKKAKKKKKKTYKSLMKDLLKPIKTDEERKKEFADKPVVTAAFKKIQQYDSNSFLILLYLNPFL